MIHRKVREGYCFGAIWFPERNVESVEHGFFTKRGAGQCMCDSYLPPMVFHFKIPWCEIAICVCITCRIGRCFVCFVGEWYGWMILVWLFSPIPKRNSWCTTQAHLAETFRGITWHQWLLTDAGYLRKTSTTAWWLKGAWCVGWLTPPKTNIAPENMPSKKETIVFQPSIFRCY